MKSFFSTKTIKQLPKRGILIVLVLVVFSGIFIFPVCQASAGMAKSFGSAVGANALGIITTLFWALQWVANWFVDMAVVILNFSFNNLLDAAFYETEFIRESWRSVRDLANMFFILWLVAIALATILNIKSWSAKKLLPKLLAIALLVNFSLLMTTVIIDFSNASTAFLANVECEYKIKGNTDRLQPAKCLKAGLNRDELLKKNSPTTFFGDNTIKEALRQLADNMFSFFILIVAGGVFLLLAVMMVVRTVALWILMIVAPAAFVVGIMPFGSKYLKQWWGKLTSWAFYAVPVAFIFRIGVTVLAAFQKPASESAGDNATTTEFAKRVSPSSLPGVGFGTDEAAAKSDFFNSMGYIFQYLVILVLLIAAYKTAQDMAKSTDDFVTGALADKGSKWGKRLASAPAKGAASRAKSGAARGAAATIDASPVKTKGMRSAVGRLRETARKEREKRREGERKYYQNASDKVVSDDAKKGNIEAAREARRRGLHRDRSRFDQSDAKSLHDTLQQHGYGEEAESTADDRPDVFGKKQPINIVNFTLSQVQGTGPNSKVRIEWEVQFADRINIEFNQGTATPNKLKDLDPQGKKVVPTSDDPTDFPGFWEATLEAENVERVETDDANVILQP